MNRLRRVTSEDERVLLKQALNFFTGARVVLQAGHPRLAITLTTMGERTLLRVAGANLSVEPWPPEMIEIFPWLGKRPEPRRHSDQGYLSHLADRLAHKVQSFTDSIENWMDRTFATVRPNTALARHLFDLSGANMDGGRPQKITVAGLNKAIGVVMSLHRRPMTTHQAAYLKSALENLNVARQLLDLGLEQYAGIFVAVGEQRLVQFSPQVGQKVGYQPNPVLSTVNTKPVELPADNGPVVRAQKPAKPRKPKARPAGMPPRGGSPR